MTAINKRHAPEGRRGKHIGDVLNKSMASASQPASEILESSSIELFDDYELANSIAVITTKDAKAADELSMYLLILMDTLGGAMPEEVRRALDRSVELAFQFTATYHAALELYTFCQRGYLSGHLSAEGLIREAIANRVQPAIDH